MKSLINFTSTCIHIKDLATKLLNLELARIFHVDSDDIRKDTIIISSNSEGSRLLACKESSSGPTPEDPGKFVTYHQPGGSTSTIDPKELANG